MTAKKKSKALTEKQKQEAFVKRAFELEQEIKANYGRVHQAWWALSEQLYDFHEGGFWAALGYGTLDEFLFQPDLGISRTQFFNMTRMWRDLVITRKVDVKELEDLEPSKVREVRPAIMRGDVTVEDALDDARGLGYRDIREKYRPEAQAQHGQKPDDSTPLAAENEIVRVQCEACGSWYVPPEDEE